MCQFTKMVKCKPGFNLDPFTLKFLSWPHAFLFLSKVHEEESQPSLYTILIQKVWHILILQMLLCPQSSSINSLHMLTISTEIIF